jgi:DNA repair exonuclease SbcCD ATPase subunit
MDKIYVHVLSNIIGLDFYLKIEELVIKHYIDLKIFSDTLKKKVNEKKEELKKKKKELKEKKEELEKKKKELKDIEPYLGNSEFPTAEEDATIIKKKVKEAEEEVKQAEEEVKQANNVSVQALVKLDKNKDDLKQTLLTIKRKLINNKLEDNNLNYQYISTEKNPENVIKELKESLKIFIDSDEIINTFETKLYPYYRDLYRITFKYLQMFISNYHKFIYNQYHGLNILLLLLDNISS